MVLEEQIQKLVESHQEFLAYPLRREALADLLHAPESLVNRWYDSRKDTIEIEEGSTSADRIFACALGSDSRYSDHVIECLTEGSKQFAGHKIIFSEAAFELEPIVDILKQAFESRYVDDILEPLNSRFEPRHHFPDDIQYRQDHAFLDSLKRSQLFFKPWAKVREKAKIEIGETPVLYKGKPYIAESIHTDDKGNMLYVKSGDEYLSGLSLDGSRLVARKMQKERPDICLDRVYSGLHNKVFPIDQLYLCQQDDQVRVMQMARKIYIPELKQEGTEIF
ncbi:MAG: hypothetical protein R6V53_02615 [Candidatus Woesearchaeota archaeon]